MNQRSQSDHESAIWKSNGTYGINLLCRLNFNKTFSHGDIIYLVHCILRFLSYIGPMKQLILLSFFMISNIINGQVIDFENFNQTAMNEILFKKMDEYTQSTHNYSVIQTSVGQRRIFRYIKNNCEKLSLDDLTLKLNQSIHKWFDSKVTKEANLVGSIGFICRYKVEGKTTYQELADLCLTDWKSSENGVFLCCTQVANSLSYHNKRTNTVYLFWGYFEWFVYYTRPNGFRNGSVIRDPHYRILIPPLQLHFWYQITLKI